KLIEPVALSPRSAEFKIVSLAMSQPLGIARRPHGHGEDQDSDPEGPGSPCWLVAMAHSIGPGNDRVARPKFERLIAAFSRACAWQARGESSPLAPCPGCSPPLT